MIHFVGAGSGAPDLITVRGMNLLKKTDCVVYAGSLVNKELLEYCRPGTEIFDSSTMELGEILEILISRDRLGKDIVRLHTGDPSLYGAIGEQIRELDKAGVDHDITPGVTAAFSAAAAIGQELTLPGITQTVIFTRAEGRTPVPEREKIRNLASAKATMAVYLSASLADSLRDELLAGGYSPETPAAVCCRVSWPDERIFITDIDGLVETVRENKLTLTTLFIVGDVIGNARFDRSRLYAADFSTCCRKASADKISEEKYNND